MLKQLDIQNYAIIDRTSIDFTNRLNIITGETGAGKSILLGALGLIMGNRADTKVLYDSSKKCFVEALFDISSYDLKVLFDQEDLDYSDELIVRREISASGKSRAFINDTPTTLNVLKALAEQLIDLHRQFDTLDIHDVSFQIRTLDALAGNQSLLENYTIDFRSYQKNKKTLSELLEQQNQSLQEMDFLSFQLKELEEVAVEEGEQEEKEQELERLSSTEDLKRVGHLIYHTLDESDNSILSSLEALANEGDSIKEVDNNLSQLYDRMYSAIEELRDLAASYNDVAEQAEYDPVRASELQNRLDTIYKLQNKHRVNSVEALLELQEELSQKIGGFQDLGSQIKNIEESIAKQEKDLLKQAKVLSKNRKSVCDGLIQSSEAILAEMQMPNARLKIQMEEKTQLSNTGIDEVNFLFASNKGSEFQAIKNVASGGELSRLTLSIKSLVADAITLPTLIFDEIDTGVSGEVAKKMGDIFAKLAKRHQVISITHSPQIAAKAHRHFFVYKEDLEDRTITSIKALNDNDRIIEIGKMLSGNPPSDAALANAKELIEAH